MIAVTPDTRRRTAPGPAPAPPVSDRPASAAARRPVDTVVDAAVVLALAVLAVGGLHHAYGPWAYLAVGAAGAGLGAGAVLASASARLGPTPASAVVVGAFLAGSGVALPARAAGVAPTPRSVTALLSGLVDAWRALLTTQPQTGIGNGLGVVPYVLGFGGAALGLVLARHTARPVLPSLPLGGALVAAFVLGTAEPVQLVLHGGVVLALVVGWGAVRQNRPRRRAEGGPHWPRLQAGTAMLAGVAALGVLAAPHLPGVDTGTRYHERQNHVPTYDQVDWASPLGAFANHLKEENRDAPVLDVTGLPAEGRIRLATLDTYDGVVWAVGEGGGPASGRFERVGDSILPVPPGPPASIEVTVAADRSDAWVPTVGATRSVRFTGERAADLTRELRYDRSTRTAALADMGRVGERLRAGDRYTLDARLPLALDEDDARNRAPVGGDRLAPLRELPQPVTDLATSLTVGATTPYDKASRLAAGLRDGVEGLATYYRDGDLGGGSGPSRSGHHLMRLVSFVENQRGLIGNAEQYAALMALMARWLGLPAHVVVGFHPAATVHTAPDGTARPDAPLPDGGPYRITNGHIDAWVEIEFDGVGPVTFDPTPPHDRRPEDDPQVRERQLELEQLEPPPPTHLQVPETIPDLVVKPPEPPPPHDEGDLLGRFLALLAAVVVASLPLLVLVAGAGALAGAKVARSRARRRRGSPVRRLSGAWRELCDRARDLGGVVPVRATRREVAAELLPTWPAAALLADAVDTAMFGASAPTGADAEAVWETLEAEHRETVAALDRWARWRAALNPASLRPGRWDQPRRRSPGPARQHAPGEPSRVPVPPDGRGPDGAAGPVTPGPVAVGVGPGGR